MISSALLVSCPKHNDEISNMENKEYAFFINPKIVYALKIKTLVLDKIGHMGQSPSTH